MPLNNQSPAAMDRSLTGGDTTTPGPPRGITLNRQNSIGAGGGGAPDRCRLRQGVSPVPAPTPTAISSTGPSSVSDRRRNVDEKSTKERVGS